MSDTTLPTPRLSPAEDPMARPRSACATQDNTDIPSLQLQKGMWGIHMTKCSEKLGTLAAATLASVAQLVGAPSGNLKVVGSTPSLGARQSIHLSLSLSESNEKNVLGQGLKKRLYQAPRRNSKALQSISSSNSSQPSNHQTQGHPEELLGPNATCEGACPTWKEESQGQSWHRPRSGRDSAESLSSVHRLTGPAPPGPGAWALPSLGRDIFSGAICLPEQRKGNTSHRSGHQTFGLTQRMTPLETFRLTELEK